jgi:hypothetical protein
MKDKGTPGGLALGNATGDSGWTQWLIWAFGGAIVDKNNKVTIDSPETIKALEYAKELYASFIPGTLSWLDPNNNKAFLDGQVSLTNNGISVYYAAKNSQDAKLKEMAGDINHAAFPIGPVGQPTEYHLFFNQMVMKYTKFPQAAKAFLQHMMEAEQFNAWLQGGGGYMSHPLKAYDANPIWTSDPKHTPVPRRLQEPASRRIRRQAGLCLGRCAGRLHRDQHGGRSGQRLEDAKGSRRTRAEARRALLQGLTPPEAACGRFPPGGEPGRETVPADCFAAAPLGPSPKAALVDRQSRIHGDRLIAVIAAVAIERA